jgi:drug/metabolite transporter (DMT)-like permease
VAAEHAHAQLTPAARGLRAAANRRGIVCMAMAMVCLVTNDALMKLQGQSMPVAQMVFLRGAMATLMVLAVARAMGAPTRLRLLASRPVAQRALADAMGTLLYLGALMHLPLGNATAINLSAPLLMALFAVLFLREQPELQRWLAIAAGFCGVLLVVQPRADGFNAWALVCFAGTVFQAGRELLTRRIDATVPSITITLASVACVTLLAAAISAWSGWQPVSLRGLRYATAHRPVAPAPHNENR